MDINTTQMKALCEKKASDDSDRVEEFLKSKSGVVDRIKMQAHTRIEKRLERELELISKIEELNAELQLFFG